MAIGGTRRIMAMSGRRVQWQVAGHRIALVPGNGIRIGDGPGFRPSLGAGRRITTGVGLTLTVAGAGCRAAGCRWGFPGRHRW